MDIVFSKNRCYMCVFKISDVQRLFCSKEWREIIVLNISVIQNTFILKVLKAQIIHSLYFLNIFKMVVKRFLKDTYFCINKKFYQSFKVVF